MQGGPRGLRRGALPGARLPAWVQRCRSGAGRWAPRGRPGPLLAAEADRPAAMAATCAECGGPAEEVGCGGPGPYCRRCRHAWRGRALPMAPGPPRALGPGGDAPAALEVTRQVAHLLREAPEAASRTHERTTLEYKGQWHPKPNGAETGHGVVPKTWDLAVVSQNDRALASYGWAGGPALCLSNAFAEANGLEAQAQDLLEQGFGEEDVCVQSVRALARASEEREAVMRRQWMDIDFQEGEASNQELLRHLERDLASQMVATASRQAEDEDRAEGCEASLGRCPWFNIKVLGGTGAGRTYLSATFQRQEGDVALQGYDDESGRHRWRLEEGGGGAWFHIRVAGGTKGHRRLLGVSLALPGEVELCGGDDGSGRQRWLLDASRRSSSDTAKRVWYTVRALGCGRCLGLGGEGAGVGLRPDDDGSGRQRWLIPGWSGPGEVDAGAEPEEREASEATAIALRSGAEGAHALAGLSPARMTRVLGDSRNLGTALDLVGCYLKNYEIDKAERLCRRIEPLVRERGGLWLFKLLNVYSVVRMKQGRHLEALAMYDEFEGLIGHEPEQKGAKPEVKPNPRRGLH